MDNVWVINEMHFYWIMPKGMSHVMQAFKVPLIFHYFCLKIRCSTVKWVKKFGFLPNLRTALQFFNNIYRMLLKNVGPTTKTREKTNAVLLFHKIIIQLNKTKTTTRISTNLSKVIWPKNNLISKYRILGCFSPQAQSSGTISELTQFYKATFS